jgi:transposase
VGLKSMAKTFREWNVEQRWLLPPSVMDFDLPDHVAHFVRDTVREQLDLSEILAPYEQEERGYPLYHPVMMTALLLYAYCQGVYSSRRIAQACENRVDFMAVTGLNRPDFRTVSDFRERHLQVLQGLFVQVLQLCQQAGLVKLGSRVAGALPEVVRASSEPPGSRASSARERSVSSEHLLAY